MVWKNHWFDSLFSSLFSFADQFIEKQSASSIWGEQYEYEVIQSLDEITFCMYVALLLWAAIHKKQGVLLKPRTPVYWCTVSMILDEFYVFHYCKQSSVTKISVCILNTNTLSWNQIRCILTCVYNKHKQIISIMPGIPVCFGKGSLSEKQLHSS